MTGVTITKRAVLAYIVTASECDDAPVHVTDVAADFDADTAVVRELLESLVACHLLVRDERGFRPTVTAHEFLALDLEKDAFTLVAVPDRDA